MWFHSIQPVCYIILDFAFIWILFFFNNCFYFRIYKVDLQAFNSSGNLTETLYLTSSLPEAFRSDVFPLFGPVRLIFLKQL